MSSQLYQDAKDQLHKQIFMNAKKKTKIANNVLQNPLVPNANIFQFIHATPQADLKPIA